VLDTLIHPAAAGHGQLTGSSMMGVQSTVTAEDGGYRFISIPPVKISSPFSGLLP
jgi:hypothetical protein